ncbi:unnamed protein product [Auanema sp. JU1783]|nr:unnamed protein product [Auanema sp. JU1783]
MKIIAKSYFRVFSKSCSFNKVLIPSKRLFSMCSSNELDNTWSVPEGVRGSQVLDTSKFNKKATLPVIEIEAKYINAVRSKAGVDSYLLKNLGKIKNFISSAEDNKKKVLIFDPETFKSDTDAAKNEISMKLKSVISDAELKWSSMTFDITFDDWDIRRIIKAVLPDNLDFSSFTQTGHIIHCNFRDELSPYKKILGEILLKKVKNCRTVVNKIDGITSEFRNFQIELVAGEPDYVADVLEGGCRFKLDFSKVFWNSRLSYEHDRVRKYFDSRSLIFDACAGVGPFVIPIVKKLHARTVVANDLNPESVRWLKESMKMNKILSSEIDVHNMDAFDFIKGPFANELIKAMKQMKSDPELTPASGAHILMNLPAFAINFLPAFKGILHGKLEDSDIPEEMFPITIYCYLFVKAHEEVPDEYFPDMARKYVLEKLNYPEANIKVIHHIRTVSSRKEMFCVQVETPLEFLRMKPDEKDEPEAKRAKLEDE